MSVLDTALRSYPAVELGGFFESRAAEVDAGRATVREGIQHVARAGLLQPPQSGVGASADLEPMVETLGSIARSDLSSAFSLWGHRMAIEYLHTLPSDAPLRADLLPRLLSGEVIGSTALAAATARYLGGPPLPLRFRRRGDQIAVSGRLAWASNLLPEFVSVTAASDEEDENSVLIVVFGSGTPGARVNPYPPLLALGATGSSSVTFDEAVVPAESVVSDDLTGFVARILPTFLLLQSAFCWGLAARGLEEAGADLDGARGVLRPDLDRLRTRFDTAGAQLRAFARRTDRQAIPLRDLLALRLEWASLASAAVQLELIAAGGRGYLSTSPTARRLREAAFLPIQAPTEVQLRWALSRFA